jgi:copper transport protein
VIRRAVICALVALLVAPAVASAHAVVERTSPGQGSTVREEPDSVAVFFDEPVEASFGAVRVFSADGEEVQSGEPFRPNGQSEGIAVHLRPGLADGSYTATYRVVSADSHPVSGGFTFAIGAPTAGGGQSVAAVLDREDAGAATSFAFWLDRAVGYAAIALAVGLIVFLLAVWRPSSSATATAFADRARRLLAGACVAGFTATVLALPLQIATVSGGSFFDALDPDLIDAVLSTRFGTVMAFRAGAWVLLAVILLAAARRANLRLAAAIPAAVLVVTPALAGHASTQSPEWLLVTAASIHVAAVSVWLGGLVALVAALPAATAQLQPNERTALLHSTLQRFSPFAVASVVALAASGTAQAIVEVGSFGALVETGFGRAVLAKIGILAVLIALGYANRQRLIPALGRLVERHETPGRVGLWLRRNLRGEVALLGVAIAVTAVLVGYAPASESDSGPVSGRTTIGAEVLEYTVEPAAAGPNQVHLYLFDSDDGSQFTGAKELRMTLSEPERDIGPLEVDLRRSGPGHYTAPAALFPSPGEWEATIAMRTSRFEEDEARIEVEIR